MTSKFEIQGMDSGKEKWGGKMAGIEGERRKLKGNEKGTSTISRRIGK